MASKKSKNINEKDVKENLPDVVITKEQASDTILDDVVATQEQVSKEVSERLQDMAQKDTAGQVFNPDIHATGRDGEPSMTSSGKYRLRKRRKDEITDEDTQRKTVADTSAGLFIQVGVAFFGDEWEPENKEFEQLSLAFDNYYKAAGVAYIPPSLGLVIAMGGYSLKRVSKPTTKTKLGKVKDAMKNKLYKLFRRNKRVMQ